MIDEPDSGVLLDDMFFADGGLVPIGPLHRHAGRGRACLHHEDSGWPGPAAPCSMCSTRPTSWCRRWKSWTRGSSGSIPQTKATRKIFDTIADNAANAGIVLGGRPLRPLDADLRWIGALCYRNGQLEETGLAAGVLNHPATSVAWLANKIAPLGLRSSPARWCWRDRSSARSRPAKATRFRPIMGLTDRSAATSPDAALKKRLGVTAMPHFTIEYSANLDGRARHGQGGRTRAQGRGRNRNLPARRHSRPRHPLRALRHRRRQSAFRLSRHAAAARRRPRSRRPPESRRTYLQGALQPISIRFSRTASSRCRSTCRSTTRKPAGSATTFTKP